MSDFTDPTEFVECDEYDEYAGLALQDWELEDGLGESIEVEDGPTNEGFFADFNEINLDDIPF